MTHTLQPSLGTASILSPITQEAQKQHPIFLLVLRKFAYAVGELGLFPLHVNALATKLLSLVGRFLRLSHLQHLLCMSVNKYW